MRGKKYTYNGLTLTAQEWADRLGVSKMTMSKRLARHGAGPQAMSSERLPDGRRPAKINVYGEEMTQAEICETFGLHRATVSRWLNSGKFEEHLEEWKERNAKKFDAK